MKTNPLNTSQAHPSVRIMQLGAGLPVAARKGPSGQGARHARVLYPLERRLDTPGCYILWIGGWTRQGVIPSGEGARHLRVLYPVVSVWKSDPQLQLQQCAFFLPICEQSQVWGSSLATLSYSPALRKV